MALLAALGTAHRLILFWRFRHVLTGLAAANPDIVVAQLFRRHVYLDHFWAAMWLLQQTPPLPHVIVRLALALGTWPDGFVQLLWLLAAAMSIITACLLQGVLRRVTGHAAVSFAVAAWFLFSTDLVVLETDFLGEQFYENLGMLCVTACCALAPSAASPCGTARLGLAAACAALTRASLCYVPIIAIVFGLAVRWRWRSWLACLLPILLLQGGWCAKNAALYGRFTLQTSSWSGQNAAKALYQTGQLPLLCSDIAAAPPGTYPDWFLSINRHCRFPFFYENETDMPASVQAFDAAMQARLGGSPAPGNSWATSLISAQYQSAISRFTGARPLLFWQRFSTAYSLFWQRIGDYGARFLAPLYVEPQARSFPGLLQRGFGEHQRLMLSRADAGFVLGPPTSRPAWFGTLSLAPLDAVSIAVLHGLFPLLAAWDAARRVRRRATILRAHTWFLAATVLYGMLVFNAVDSGENMRFRLAIEPAIIALTFASLTVARQRLAPASRRRSPAPA